jgi:UDP-glucose 4-epimerase
MAILAFASFLSANPFCDNRDLTNPRTILITGGAGFIGSHVNELLHSHGYQTVVLDNLSKGSRTAVLHGKLIEGDIANDALLDQIFTSYKIDVVMHFAAFTEVGDSVFNPLKYYENNVVNTLKLLNAMQKHHVNIFIFSSTATIFGNIPQEQKGMISEETPRCSMSPYGRSKQIIEEILPDFEQAYGLRFCCLRYFNVSGGDPNGRIKNERLNHSNLIPIVLNQLLIDNGSVTIFGTDYPTPDGTAVRDYIHVMDIGAAHIAAMERLWKGGKSSYYNLGNGRGYSVREVIAAAMRVVGKEMTIFEGKRRLGDPAILIADSTKAQQELGWQPKYPSLEMMIEHYLKESHFIVNTNPCHSISEQ